MTMHVRCRGSICCGECQYDLGWGACSGVHRKASSLPHLLLSALHVSVHSRAFFDKRLAQEVEGSALGEVSRSRQLLSSCRSHIVNECVAQAGGAAAASAGSNRRPRQRRQQLTAPATSGWRADANSGAVTSCFRCTCQALKRSSNAQPLEDITSFQSAVIDRLSPQHETGSELRVEQPCPLS
jgi:hypothetical protein